MKNHEEVKFRFTIVVNGGESRIYESYSIKDKNKFIYLPPGDYEFKDFEYVGFGNTEKGSNSKLKDLNYKFTLNDGEIIIPPFYIEYIYVSESNNSSQLSWRLEDMRNIEFDFIKSEILEEMDSELWRITKGEPVS